MQQKGIESMAEVTGPIGAPKERPILFSGAMVRALLDGSKTQTRRPVKPQPEVSAHGNLMGEWLRRPLDGLILPKLQDISIHCPYGQHGDHLWVRETFFAYGRWETRFSAKKGRDEWHFVDMTLLTGRKYRYEGALPNAQRAGATPAWWRRPSIHMPRAASRITLEVTDVRVERLQAISAADARAEGIEFQEHLIAGQVCRSWRAYGSPNGWYPEGVDTAPIHSYRILWDSLNAARGYGWDVNPWVWVVEFKKVGV
jgi:hypothetical protein